MIELQEGVVPEINHEQPYAIVAITKHGVALARELHEKFSASDVYYMAKFEQGDEAEKGIQLFTGTVRLLLPALFKSYKGLLLIISIGAVVRMIAPILKDKMTDPGVVVIDDRGHYAISVLSGHMGGANELAREAAAVIGAEPVITTASDVQKTIPVDLFGARFGWTWESSEKLTPVSAAVVNEEEVAVVLETGERNWWMYDTPMPPNLKVFSSVKEALAAKPAAALLVTDRLLEPEENQLLVNGVLYRPKSIVLGMGCNRGTPAEEIEQLINETLSELKLSKQSVKALCTIDLKKDEQGFLDVSQKYGWDFVTYSPAELNAVPIQEPSETVFKFTGAFGVSEPAVICFAGETALLLPKKKAKNATISVARLTFEEE